jgi:diaminopimelate epimerase
VVIVDDLDSYPVARIGRALETHERFPAGANVEFVAPVDREAARVRVWERGVGETAACGTGACAALVGAQRLGHLGEEVVLSFPGGDVTVRYDPDEQASVLLTGGAVELAWGEVDPGALGRDTAGGR